jgi:hypothetical protein
MIDILFKRNKAGVYSVFLYPRLKRSPVGFVTRGWGVPEFSGHIVVVRQEEFRGATEEKLDAALREIGVALPTSKQPQAPQPGPAPAANLRATPNLPLLPRLISDGLVAIRPKPAFSCYALFGMLGLAMNSPLSSEVAAAILLGGLGILALGILGTVQQAQAPPADDFHTSGIRKRELGQEKCLCRGSWEDLVRWRGDASEVGNLAQTFPSALGKMRQRYPVLEEEICGTLTLELCENLRSACEINVRKRILRIDKETLASPYLLELEFEEELGHLARSILDSRACPAKRNKDYYTFWAEEEYATDYLKAKRFSQDYEAAEKKGRGAKERLVSLQAEALVLLVQWSTKYPRINFIQVIFNAISQEHKEALCLAATNLLKEKPLLSTFKPALAHYQQSFPAFSNEADLERTLRDYFSKAYKPGLAQCLPATYQGLSECIRTVLGYYQSLEGSYGPGVEHGLNKQELLRKRALAGKKAFFDLLVVVVEDISEKETAQMLQDFKGEVLHPDTEVLLVTQPLKDTAEELKIKGCYSAIINLTLRDDLQALRRVEHQDGSVAVILSAGTAKRNAGQTHSGWGDKGKQTCLNGRPYLRQVVRQLYHYWTPELKGVVVTTNDGIKALGAKVVLGEYGIEMIGAARLVSDPELDDLGIAEVLLDGARERRAYAQPIIKMHEKKTESQRLALFGTSKATRVPTNWADYYFSWSAWKKVREHYKKFTYRRANGKTSYLHLLYGLDMAMTLFEGATTYGKAEFVRRQVEKYG